MRFFGYYAVHSFVNQLRKIFKTWVLVFILVCGLMGGLIGYGAAMLEDTIEENQDPAAVEVIEEEEDDGWELPIPGTALMELIAGGALLAFFAFEALSADTNGSKIFLPADVNLLFPSPMKPQSVLMFRLGTQLGTALAATIYLMFQIPNLMMNLGLSGWAAAAIMITWFAGILIGKLLQVLLYTLCSSHAGFKPYLRRGLYALGALLAVGFYITRSGSEHILVSADRFLNAPLTRWIPFWGWLKGLTVYVAEQNWAGAAICLLLLAAGSAALVYGIWHMNADFYEDAMAKSEETAALMEKAKSEKTSGVAATRQRKKERKDSLKRDGMNRGRGASVFFWKSMYNRFRFAQLGFLTKTMETYFVAALGMAAAMRFYFQQPGETAVVLTLGALVFFRAMGNPLAEDTSMDFFRLIPESTWQKLLYSQLAGTVNCILDLVLPMLAASALLTVNPAKLFLWLPMIVSVDFYAASVVTFIDLSVPASIGKTIKQIITIFFIYFGLIPDIAILAFGIVLGHTPGAAIGATALNLALGTAAFSLASVFLAPKGRDYTAAAENVDLKQAKKDFSRLGLAVFAILAIVIVLQLGASAIIGRYFPELMDRSWLLWAITFVPQYLVAMPIGLRLMGAVPAHAPKKQKLGAGRAVKYFFISAFIMYGGNILGNLITTIIGNLLGSPVVNPLETIITGENLFLQVLCVVFLAPLFEEYVFRKALIDRMRIYGGKTAVLLSALLFGLFHGNLSQFFYAFGLGLVFGYIYLNTGKLRCTVIAHMIINFLGSVLSVELLKRVPEEALESFAFDGPGGIWLILFGGYVLLLIVSAIVGLVLFFMNLRNLKWPAGERELPKGVRFRVSYLNVGMLLITAGCLGMIVRSFFG